MKHLLLLALLATACSVKAGGNLTDALIACGPGNSCPAPLTCDDGTCVPAAGGDGGITNSSCVTAIGGGEVHTCIIKSDGTAWCWGRDDVGELGDGDTTNKLHPVQVSGLANVTAIAGGWDHTCAISGSGSTSTVWCWGANYDGQLGTGTTEGSTTPKQVTGLTGVDQITTGYAHTCARLGTQVMCWGIDQEGDLGNGMTSDHKATPVQTQIGVGVVDLATSDDSSCAVGADGSVWCWGEDTSGELGDGTMMNRPTPKPIAGLTGATQVAMSEQSGCAETGSGVWCWGTNNFSQLGNGTEIDKSLVPVRVATEVQFAKLQGGDYHYCGLTAAGELWCWGDGYVGQLFDGDSTEETSPRLVMHDVVDFAAGGEHSCAKVATGALVCAGLDDWGQLGDGVQTTQPVPAPLSPGSGAVLAPSGDNTCAIMPGGTVECWGDNADGELGDGSYQTRGTRAPVGGLANVAQVDGGDDETCALTTAAAGSAVWCWGMGYRGALGNNSFWDSPEPVQVTLPGPAIQVSSGSEHSCAVMVGGTIQCWGAGNEGELGNGATADSAVPVPVTGIATATQVSCGFGHCCAVLANQTVQCWGENDAGDLGLGSGSGAFGNAYDTPVPIDLAVGATQVLTQGRTTCALMVDKSLWCWGMSYDGQVGNGSFDVVRTPAQVMAGVTSFTVGDGILCAIDGAQALSCWGYNSEGAVGNGSYNDQGTPTQVLTGVAAAASDDDHVCAQQTSGAYSCWGNDPFGQLGDGVVDWLTVHAVGGLTCP